METNDGGETWEEREIDLPADENFRLISIDFNGDEGWIAGQPGLLLHSDDAGQSWSRLLLDTKLPGDPYLITALGPKKPNWPPTLVRSTRAVTQARLGRLKLSMPLVPFAICAGGMTVATSA